MLSRFWITWLDGWPTSIANWIYVPHFTYERMDLDTCPRVRLLASAWGQGKKYVLFTTMCRNITAFFFTTICMHGAGRARPQHLTQVLQCLLYTIHLVGA